MSVFKTLKECTFDDFFRIGKRECRLICTTAAENLKHLGQVCVTSGKQCEWVNWNTRVEIVN